MKKLILEYKYSGHQKLNLIIFAFLNFSLLLFFFNQIPKTQGFTGFIIFGTTFTILVIQIVSKRGFLIKDNKLYCALFFFGNSIFKKKMDLNNKPAFSILRFNKKQKFAFVSIAKPDMVYNYKSFDIYLLNQNHTKRWFVLSLKKEINSKKTIDFLTTNTSLKFEKFSPNFRE